MTAKRQLEFFLLRYVPDAVKDEFVNIGVVMFEPAADSAGFADVRFTRDWRRVRCIDPDVDTEMLEALERDIRAQLTGDREVLLRKIADSFSNVIQVSPMKACLAEEPAKEIETLARLYFEGPKRVVQHLASGRQQILGKMRESFEQAGVWKFLMHGIPVEPYTKAGDPFKFDFGYRVGDEIKLFHAVSLKASVDQAVMLASRYPKIAANMTTLIKARPVLTAVVDDALDRKLELVQFALSMMEEERIKIATAAEMPQLAEVVRRELGA